MSDGCLKRVLPSEPSSSDKPELDMEQRKALFTQAVRDVKEEEEVRFRLDCPERAQVMLDKVYAGDIEGYREVYRMMSRGIIPQCPRTDDELKCAELLQKAFTYASGHGWYKKGFTPGTSRKEGNDAIGI